MIRVDKELIAKELARDIEKGLVYKRCKLSNKFLDNLFNKYYVLEACENFYDSEPDIDKYISDMAYMCDYYTEEDENNPFRKYTKKYILETYGKEYSKDEAIRCKIEHDRIYDEYFKSDKRLSFLNWQEVYFEGNWGMSQKHVDRISRRALERLKRLSISKKDRTYFAEDDDMIKIYIYGRDNIYKDWWFIFRKKGIDTICSGNNT